MPNSPRPLRRKPETRPGAEAARPRNAAIARLEDAGPASVLRGEPRAWAGADISRQALVGALGYGLHGATFLALAIAALAYFGSIFWFVSAVCAGLALSSLYHGYAALRARESAPSERRP